MIIKIAPSILAADYARLGEDIKEVEKAGPDFWHIDVMDGNFVPNISIGASVVKAIRPFSRLPFEAHLMIREPLKYVESFLDAGSDIITLHIETIGKSDYKNLADRLHKGNKKIAVSLNPDTPASKIRDVAGVSDMVLVMTVNPGFGGQKFMEEVVPKISEIRSFYQGDIAVDGGINDKNAPACIKAGANILACGSYIFKAKDKKTAMESLRKCLI